MYSIIQKIYEKNNKILKEGIKKVLGGEDVSSLTIAIKEFTDIFGHLTPETQQYLLLMAKELLNTQQKLLSPNPERPTSHNSEK